MSLSTERAYSSGARGQKRTQERRSNRGLSRAAAALQRALVPVPCPTLRQTHTMVSGISASLDNMATHDRIWALCALAWNVEAGCGRSLQHPSGFGFP
eukprot:5735239-Prymnesium_polylepis.1